MIILAAAIILSLSNSGIIGKANKAKTDSDTANLKEYVNTLRAEWELMTVAEQTTEGSFEAYANKKLEKSGYKVMLSDDGVLMNENATAAVKKGIKIGDVVTGYATTSTTYTTDGSENTSPNNVDTEPQPQTVTTNTDITWKYLGISKDGEIEIMADLSTSNAVADETKLQLSGKGGSLNGPVMLNKVCENLYSVSGVGTARSMNIDDVDNILGYTGPKGEYIDTNSNIVTTAAPLTIGEIESKLGVTLSMRITPDGKELSKYYANYHYINKTSENIKNTANKDLVYNAKNAYWLASPCVNLDFGTDYAAFDVYFVCPEEVASRRLSDVNNNGFDGWFDAPPLGISERASTVRPVVKLDPSIKVEKDSTAANTWNISK